MTSNSRRSQKVRIPFWRQITSQLHNVPRALKFVWVSAPVWMVASTVLLVVQGILPVLTVYLTRYVVNATVTMVQSGVDQTTLVPVIAAVLAFGLVLLAIEVLGSVDRYVQAVLAERTQDYLHRVIQAKAIVLDLKYFESPEYYDQLRRATIDALGRPMGLLQNLSDLLQNGITLVAMAGVLFSFVWWMPFVLLLGTAPALWVALRAAIRFHAWRRRATVDQRRLYYYHYLLTSNEYAPEVRLFALGRHVSRAYQKLSAHLRGEQLALAKQQMWGQIFAGVVGLLSMLAAFLWMAWQALQGKFNLGDLAMYWQAMNQGQRLMRSLLTGAGDLYRNLNYLDDLFAFLDLEPVLRDPEVPAAMPGGIQKGIQLRDVTFRYPGSERTALQQFNLTVPAGQIVAIVGENGAGKSTLIKLICRLYDPEGGQISWDDLDLRSVAQGELRRRITVLFQQPVNYHATAAENIEYGDVEGALDRDQITAAAAAAAADTIIEKLPNGYDTLLGKWFGNAELSTGEWQRLALARAFVRKADLVILDEPTSAMDSWAEAAWMERFRDLVQGRTALIVTHRFTTAMQADVIHVMADGCVVESGSHTELLAQGGRYATSWRQQMREAPASAGLKVGAM